jgi:hypothetical protein
VDKQKVDMFRHADYDVFEVRTGGHFVAWEVEISWLPCSSLATCRRAWSVQVPFDPRYLLCLTARH